MVKVLVTGGAGFIGSHTIDQLVEHGFAVKVIDNLSTGSLNNIKKHLATGAVEFLKGDISTRTFKSNFLLLF
jgi:UDP-glucose 4-epimerase